MPKGCLFPDSIPNRDICQRYLTQLTREGSYKLGGFHCLLPKDRITWDNQYIVHIYYIHVRTVVKEVYTSKELLLSFLSSKAWDWSLIWGVPAREPKREVLPLPPTLLRLDICDQEPRDYLATTPVAVWDLSISPTGNSPALSLVRIKRPGSSNSRCQQ